MDEDETPPFQMIRNRDMPRRLAISKTTFYELRDSDPTFPPARKLGIAARGYIEADVEAWVRSSKEEKR